MVTQKMSSKVWFNLTNMKQVSPQELIRLAAEKEGITVEELEQRYEVARRKVNDESADNLPTKPIRFIHTPQAGALDTSKLEFQ